MLQDISRGNNVIQAYEPVVKKYLSAMPALYAFRAASDELGAISMAQGSPLFGPPKEVEDRVRQIRDIFTDSDELGFALSKSGYPSYGSFQCFKEVGIQFLQEVMGIAGSDDELSPKVLPGGYARTMLRNFIMAYASEHSMRSEDRMIVTNGCWPLIFDISQELLGIPIRQTDASKLDFNEYKKIIESEDRGGKTIIYFCDPNNPLDYKYTDQEISQFLRDVKCYTDQTGKQILILADNPYWGWCNPEYIRENGFPSFTRVADRLHRETGVDARPNLVEIFSLSKALGLASHGGSVSIHHDPELVKKAHSIQVNLDGIPTYDQTLYSIESLRHVLQEPGYIQDRSLQIHNHLLAARDIINHYFPDGNDLNVRSGFHGAYIALELGESLFGQSVLINGASFTIRTPVDFCIFALEKHGVALAPLDKRDSLPNTVRMFVDLESVDVFEGARRFCNAVRELAECNNSK